MKRSLRGARAVWLLLPVLAVVSVTASPESDGTPSPLLRERLAATARRSATDAPGTPLSVRDGQVWAHPAPAATLVAAGEVLPVLHTRAPLPSPETLGPRLARVAARPALGPRVAYQVRDVATGLVLAGRDDGRALSAASTTKVLTGAAALSVLGPGNTVPTRVLPGATPEELVLLGGGDVLLSAGRGSEREVNGRAGLADLADETARRLRESGRTRVSLRVDDSLFTGPALPPGADAGDVAAGFVAPATALAVDAGRVRPGHNAPRHADPALAAGRAFARLLTRRGIDVTGRVVRARAVQGQAPLAEVRSASVAEVVEYMLSRSDNTVAEALARLVAARTNRPATPTDAGVAVVDQVDLLGVDVAGVSLVGGSGLGRSNVIPPRTLTELLALAADSGHPELRALFSGMPVAGASGTLGERFGDGSAAAGRVRAKTGTLSGVSALAGTVTDADGRLLAFAVLADRTRSTGGAEQALDAFATVLAGCGCL